jgi:hypothetical protein
VTMPADFIRVEDKATGHQFSIREDQFDDAAVKKIDKPALDPSGDVLPPKHKTTVTKAVAAKAPSKPAEKVESE